MWTETDHAAYQIKYLTGLVCIKKAGDRDRERINAYVQIQSRHDFQYTIIYVDIIKAHRIICNIDFQTNLDSLLLI